MIVIVKDGDGYVQVTDDGVTTTLFPNIDDIGGSGGGEGGGGSECELYYTSNMIPYAKDMHIPRLKMGLGTFGLMSGAENLETVICDETRLLGGSQSNRVNEYFRNCTKLNSADFPYVQGFITGYTNFFFSGCTSLKKVTFGSIGHPITDLQSEAGNDRIFRGVNQSDLVITVYVNANAISNIPTEVTTNAPWGATNATIVYKSSVTGEVLE